ncbi:TetR/AcrR family transcriptional regulator [Rhodococcoides corynebacterioides]|uniref:TetR/AcrR family transcriptional regulator n=1 Tax=Rhodococcoides corynebacterioides TaxID=53972 RepID=UPI003F7D9302
MTPSTPLIRNTDRTRSAVLRAGARLLAERGLATSIADVAAAANVSKSGLMHHFPTRDELFLAVVQNSVDRFRTEVLSMVDLSENHPGKGLRAYVRALCGDNSEALRIFAWEFGGPVDAVPGATAVLREDSRTWQTFFTNDGLHPDRVLVVRHAVEGFALASFYDDTYDDAMRTHARRVFLELIDTDSWRPDSRAP